MSRKIRWSKRTPGVGHDPATNTWVATWYESGKKKWKRGLPGYQEAKTYKRERERSKSRSVSPGVETVESLCASYADDFTGRGGRQFAETTKRWYRERLSKFARDFHGRRLSEITRTEAMEWARENRDRVRAVSAMYADAVRYEVDGLTSNPFQGLTGGLSKGRKNITVLSAADLLTLLEIARSRYRGWGPQFAAVIQTAAWTGLRPGELFALEWPDIDWEQGVIHVQRNYRSKTGELVGYTKNGHDRWVGLLPRAAEALRAVTRIEDDPVVFHSPQGKRLKAQGLQYHWGPVRDLFTDRLPRDHWLKRRIAADPKDRLDFYELRHLFGTTLANAGASPYVIAAQMGHQDGGKLAMNTYIHTDALEAAEQTRRLFVEDPSVAPASSTAP